ncbi:transposase, partial [Leptolyngbya sp. FACHB-541]|uniref:transposase n=1 Tax=Leptolyngbya sp. FACHB-541 TaxID=2692810 RepID=UPI00168207A5
IQLDNGRFHKAKRLKVPDNIVLMFQPPHCPELNPIEQVWQYLKRRLRWSLPTTLDQLRQQVKEQLGALTPEVVASIVGRQSILDALSVAGL